VQESKQTKLPLIVSPTTSLFLQFWMQCSILSIIFLIAQSSQAQTQQIITDQSYTALRSFGSSGATVYPLVGTRISSRFGMRTHPVIHKQRHHHGLDLAAPIEAPVRAIREGRVVFADSFGNYGNLIVIQHGNEITSHYGHLNSIHVQTGQLVTAGQVIGAVGKTGRVTGAHLHFEIRYAGKSQDPLILFPNIAQAGHG
jgi:murein DD-endopeptidase MepM/ murein hydrolase activator NlpD